jgi:hypothetical protein
MFTAYSITTKKKHLEFSYFNKSCYCVRIIYIFLTNFPTLEIMTKLHEKTLAMKDMNKRHLHCFLHFLRASDQAKSPDMSQTYTVLKLITCK